MQHAGGYLDQKTRSPISLGAAVAINGALIGALLFASPEVMELAPKIFTTIRVPPAITPSKPPPKPRAEVPQNVRTIRTVTQPPIRFEQPTNTVTREETHFTFPTDPPGTGVIRPIDPPIPKPILTGTRLDPRYAGQMQPDYPAGLQRRQIEGLVEVRVLVGPDGRVKAIEPITATDPAFYRATVEQAMKRWRFLPATRDGVAVEAWRVMTVRFRLDGQQ